MSAVQAAQCWSNSESSASSGSGFPSRLHRIRPQHRYAWLEPVAVFRAARRRRKELVELYRTATRWALVLTLPVTVFALAQAELILTMWPNGRPEAGDAMRLVVIGQFGWVVVGSVNYLLMMHGRPWQVLLNALPALAVNVGLCFLWIPELEETGASLAISMGGATWSSTRSVSMVSSRLMSSPISHPKGPLRPFSSRLALPGTSSRPRLAACMTTDPAKRFSSKVANYVATRPDYQSGVIDLLGPTGAVADIGAGTGILSQMLLAAGWRVHAVEPNKPMAQTALASLGDHPQFHLHMGRAENTGLPDHSVEGVVAAQAFHWFEPDRARIEFQRIMKPGGQVTLVWNDRDAQNNALLGGYQEIIDEFGTDYDC